MEHQNKQNTENMVLLNIHFLMSRLRKWYTVVTTCQSPKLVNKIVIITIISYIFLMKWNYSNCLLILSKVTVETQLPTKSSQLRILSTGLGLTRTNNILGDLSY